MVLRVIHQQVRQVMWQFLACLGLVMIMPIEEAFVNLKDGDGFYSGGMAEFGIMLAVPLMGLIACSNVQADFREGHCDFWRSKPVRTKLFVTLKFFSGLIMGLVLMACPAVFGMVSVAVCDVYDLSALLVAQILGVASIFGVIVYSFCFASNMVIRRTARGWLIGLTLACLAVLLPFMLPLGFKDFGRDLFSDALKFYIIMSVVILAVPFLFSLFAADRNWHLRTNLKGLLWAGAGLLFSLMMFFSSQVANIKVLDEVEVKSVHLASLTNIDGEIVLNGQSYVEIDDNTISLKHDTDRYGLMPSRSDFPRVDSSYDRMSRYPGRDPLYKKIGGDLYAFEVQRLWRELSPEKTIIVEKVFLVSYRQDYNNWQIASLLDMSDSIDEKKRYAHAEMRLIGDKLVVLVNKNVMVVDAGDPGELKFLSKEAAPFMGRRSRYYKQKKFTYPLLPAEGISVEERVKLSIDLAYSRNTDVYKHSMVDMHDGKISYFEIDSDRGVFRVDVTGWDDKKIYCEVGAMRNFTLLERMTQEGGYYTVFVQDGRLYAKNSHELLVFDVRTGGRIRKLGHFVCGTYDLRDIEVLEDGNILLCWRWEQRVLPAVRSVKSTLGLLKRP